MNFKSMAGRNDRQPTGNAPLLVRQPSIYSLTFEEFQNTLGGLGKDFGSMNMDEFLKNIWTAEETQVMAAAFGAFDSGATSSGGGVPLQRQGSLTLPRTLSQKTVDEVWRDISREGGGKDGNGSLGLGAPQREPTLGEMTLEEFLVRAGVVREDTQLAAAAAAATSTGGFFGQLPRGNHNACFNISFQQPGRLNGSAANQGPENYHQIPPNQPQNLAMDVSGGRTAQHQLFSKPASTGLSSSLQLGNKVESVSQSVRSGAVSFGEPAVNSGFMRGDGGNVQSGGGMGMLGLGAGGVSVTTESPVNQLSLDRFGKNNGGIASLSPVPHHFNSEFRGRKCSVEMDRGVEKKQKRMIKNRESAARSRARKQAYTMELEAEVAKLKEENSELQKKQLLQARIMEIQKKQVLEMINQQQGLKKRSLRRTLTGPW